MNQKENKEFDLDDLWEEGLDELKVEKEQKRCFGYNSLEMCSGCDDCA